MRIGANLTSMIDIIFLLVVFFVLVSRISEVEQIPLELPEPNNPATSNASDQARAIVNMPADADGSATIIRLNTGEFPADATGIDIFTRELANILQRNPELEITLRADRRLDFRDVAATMNAISAAGSLGNVPGAVRMNLVIVNRNVTQREVNDDA